MGSLILEKFAKKEETLIGIAATLVLPIVIAIALAASRALTIMAEALDVFKRNSQVVTIVNILQEGNGISFD